MAKAPVGGRVKTRLAASIGVVAATFFYRHLLGAVVGRLARDRRWETWLAVSPDPSAFWHCWPIVHGKVAQGQGDLGARMQRVLDWPGAGPTVIIGADIPDVSPADIAAAFARLGDHDAVLGPAPDGGYWLVGAKRNPRIVRPFGAVRWSSEHALADTLEGLRNSRVAMLRPLADVDGIDDWGRCRGRSGRRVVGAIAQHQGNAPSMRPQK
jgi:rSAM/selenodomain-associated transferase 1